MTIKKTSDVRPLGPSAIFVSLSTGGLVGIGPTPPSEHTGTPVVPQTFRIHPQRGFGRKLRVLL